MGIDSIIKNSFLNNFTETISLSTVITTGQMSLAFAAVVYIVYLITCDKTIYSKKFNVAMSLMTITAPTPGLWASRTSSRRQAMCCSP